MPRPMLPLENYAGWFEEKRRHSPTERFFAEATFVNTGVSFIFAEDDIENLKERRVRIKREMSPWSMGSYYTVQPP